MAEKYQIYDTASSRNIGVRDLTSLFNDLGCERIFFKKLAPNDNSKNQPYFASHLTDLSFFHTGNIVATQTTSLKTGANKRRTKFTAEFPLVWIDTLGKEYPAPNSKLIYYPQYPEVRFSGFLAGSSIDCKKWMDPYEQGRDEGRVLVLGANQNRKLTFAFLATPESRISNEIDNEASFKLTNVFQELLVSNNKIETSSRNELLKRLKAIHLKGWINSKRLDKSRISI